MAKMNRREFLKRLAQLAGGAAATVVATQLPGLGGVPGEAQAAEIGPEMVPQKDDSPPADVPDLSGQIFEGVMALVRQEHYARMAAGDTYDIHAKLVRIPADIEDPHILETMKGKVFHYRNSPEEGMVNLEITDVLDKGYGHDCASLPTYIWETVVQKLELRETYGLELPYLGSTGPVEFREKMGDPIDAKEDHPDAGPDFAKIIPGAQLNFLFPGLQYGHVAQFAGWIDQAEYETYCLSTDTPAPEKVRIHTVPEEGLVPAFFENVQWYPPGVLPRPNGGPVLRPWIEDWPREGGDYKAGYCNATVYITPETFRLQTPEVDGMTAEAQRDLLEKIRELRMAHDRELSDVFAERQVAERVRGF